ncbi:MAG: YdcF family protein [Planctomycetota bacterium]
MALINKFGFLLAAIGRGAAVFFGVLAVIGFVAGLRGIEGLDLLWIDLRRIPWMGSWFLPPVALVFFMHGIGSVGSRFRRTMVFVVAGAIGLVALENSWVVMGLQEAGRIQSSALPLSLLIVGSMVLIGISALNRPLKGKRVGLASVVVASLFAASFPWLQIQTLGQTDYRRPAAAIVVLGARTYADGKPSRALGDRVKTACRLYHDGLASQLIFSGGPGDGDIHETESMQNLAIELGVDPRHIVLDRKGLNTRATIDFVQALKVDGRVLYVSHDFHLPRIWLAARLSGIDVLTVPAETERPLPRRGSLLVRETAAYWYYLAQGLWS